MDKIYTKLPNHVFKRFKDMPKSRCNHEIGKLTRNNADLLLYLDDWAWKVESVQYDTIKLWDCCPLCGQRLS